jgi:3-hydroxyisobutyrate dehydrogenase-like beta-hydroxyacid dehydrogenase
MNSASPKSKKSAARELEMAGVKYVDVAIASPVEIDALSVPLLISGPHAKNAASALSSIGFENVRVVGNQVGDAAAIQMIRQVAILGFESITAECLLAAKASGLLTEVVASFGPNWLSDAEQRIDQMLTRGTRNAEVLTEVCATLYDLGVNPYGSLSTTMRQRELGQAKVASNSTTLDQKLESLTRKNGT